MKLTKVTIHKYKSFSSEQNFDVEDDITVLVGMNESGKTSILEAIAKTNYFQEDGKFKFNSIHDYPRSEVTEMRRSKADAPAVTCTYEIDNHMLNEINQELGNGVLTETTFSVTKNYANKNTVSIGEVSIKKFINHQIEILDNPLETALIGAKNQQELEDLKQEFSNDEHKNAINLISDYFKNKNGWDDPIAEYIYRVFLEPSLPKFLYYDEYYALPGRIDIKEMLENKITDESQKKTAHALFEVAGINAETITQSSDFEEFIAELESTSISISKHVFTYWTANQNLTISFMIDTKDNQCVLDIRVKHKEVSLPLENRSKGFNWFFSFIIWFKKIQEDKNSNYILLLDEPGINLHASAQNDLLRFLEDLNKNYQIIYTTHSPFMITPEKLNRVRTVQETEEGSQVLDSIQQKDPNTLFPLQAALGYDIAQNLFISPKNLLVEGVSDLIILTTMSAALENAGRTSLNEDITIVPVGGLNKVTSFISLLRGQKLNVACLLDSRGFGIKDKEKLNDLVKENIIRENKIRFYNDYLNDHDEADLEDLFEKSDYIKLYNSAFSEQIEEKDLNSKIKPILIQINKLTGKNRFNHYGPARALVKIEAEGVSKTTLDNFEKVFEDINKILSPKNNKK